MVRWQWILIGIGALLSGILSALEFIEKDTLGDSKYLKSLACFTVDNRPLIALLLGILAGLIISGIAIFQPRITQNKFRESLIDGIFEQVLNNDKTKARITLFRDAGFLKRWWYRVLDFFGLLKKGWKLKRILKYCYRAQYVSIFKRWGTEHRKSKTHFYFDSQTAANCQGVAAQVRQREEEIVVSLPNLDGIDLQTVNESHPAVREFMDKGYINDVSVIRKLNKTAPFIYGNIISVAGGRKKYVLVIDSWTVRSPFKPARRRLLSTYIKQISNSFGA